jgi:membrane fusion protein (multidrug efflux system)
MKRLSVLLLAAVCTWPAGSPSSELIAVVAKPVARTIDLPGELLPYLSVPLHAKVTGYIERVLVDRGSIVRQGDLLIELTAPEIKTRIAQAESAAQTAESQRVEAEAQLAAAQSTYERLQKAAATPGAVAGNEVILAQKQVEAAQAVVRSRQESIRTAQAAVQAEKDLEAYLKITAPFDGVVTERLVHPGALVGPGTEPALLVIQQVARLRLVVPVPEEDAGGVMQGVIVPFRVPAFPDRAYSGTVARSAHALDPKNRTLPVELDVLNRDGSLAPGMYPSVKWPVRSSRTALYVPSSSVVSTTERTFVIRAKDGKAQWVNVKTGPAEGGLVEVRGDLHAGDKVVRLGTDEIREGNPLPAPAK